MILVLFPVILIAQPAQKEKNEQVFKQVENYFNSQQADSIYALAGNKFKAALSKEAFSDVAAKQLFPLGKIKKSTFISFKNNISTYKLAFDGTDLQMLLSLDETDHLEMFLFQPFKEPVPDKASKAKSSNTLKTALDIQVDSIAQNYMQKGNTRALAIGLLKDGKLYTYGYGETKKGSNTLPDENTIFEIGSVSKTFTAILLAGYIVKNKVKLTDPVTKYLPDSVSDNKHLQSITLQNLSNHTSGLPRLPDNINASVKDPLNPYAGYTVPMLFTYLKNYKPGSVPGSKYAYSNLGVGLLGVILEKISGKTYEDMVKSIITQPLQMNRTVQNLNEEQRTRFVPVHNENGEETKPWDFQSMAAAGSLRSTVHDLLLYAQANLKKNNTNLSKAMQLTQQITFNNQQKIGLGWHMADLNNKPFYTHSGGTYGSSSFVAYTFSDNSAVVVLSNAAESTDQTGIALLKCLTTD